MIPRVTLVLVGVSALLSFLPGAGDWLQYDRLVVDGGQIWRPLTGQLVHWTARMALLDLVVLLGLGIWLERISRRALIGTLIASALLVAVAVHLMSRELMFYRGSSGLATAVFTGVALALLFDREASRFGRGVGLLALVLLAAKIVWESTRPGLLMAGELPLGVQVAPIVHLFGALGAVAAWSITLGRRRVR